MLIERKNLLPSLLAIFVPAAQLAAVLIVEFKKTLNLSEVFFFFILLNFINLIIIILILIGIPHFSNNKNTEEHIYPIIIASVTLLVITLVWGKYLTKGVDPDSILIIVISLQNLSYMTTLVASGWIIFAEINQYVNKEI